MHIKCVSWEHIPLSLIVLINWIDQLFILGIKHKNKKLKNIIQYFLTRKVVRNMAGVGTVIKQVSKLSFSLHKMTETLNRIETAVGDAFNSTAIQEITDKVNQYENGIQNVENQLINVDAQLDKIENQTKKVEKSGSLLSNAYKKVASAVKTIDIKDVLNKSDELLQTMVGLNQISDGSQSTSELFDMIYASAKNAHAPLMSTADAIITMGNSTGDLFGSNQELIDFMNQVNKQFAIGGASATEQSSALEQLSQSMASGVINGSEMNKILEAAPGIASAIEEKMEWAEGSLMSYANQGAVTAEVVKVSLLNMSDETNEAFECIPLTFSQVMTDLQSDATRIFQPISEKLNGITQSEAFDGFLNGAINAMAVVANIIMAIMDSMGAVAGFIYDNWAVISPLIYGAITALGIYMLALGAYNAIQAINSIQKVISTVQEYAHAKAVLANAEAQEEKAVKTAEATVEQASFNTTLLASPVTWITLAIIALVVALVAFANQTAKSSENIQTGFGAICGWINVAIQWFKNLGIEALNTFFGIINAMSALGYNISTAFGNAISGVKAWFFDLLATALPVIADIAEGLNKLPFVEIDYSGISTKAEEFALKAREEEANIKEYKDIGEAFDTGYEISGLIAFEDGWKEEAMARGAAWGDNKMNNFTSGLEELNYDSGEYELGIPETTQNDIAATADNTASLNDSVDISNENLKYLKDVAERDSINRFTTAPIKLTMNNHNNISSNMDLDGVINYLTIGMTDTINQAAEGEHA